MARYFYFPFVSAVLNMREHGCLHYFTLLAANNIQGYYICQRYVRVSYPLILAGLNRFSDLKKFTLQTCSEKPEMDIMRTPISSKAKLFSDRVKKTTVTFRCQLGEILQKPPWGQLFLPLPV